MSAAYIQEKMNDQALKESEYNIIHMRSIRKV